MCDFTLQIRETTGMRELCNAGTYITYMQIHYTLSMLMYIYIYENRSLADILHICKRDLPSVRRFHHDAVSIEITYILMTFKKYVKSVCAAESTDIW